MSLIPLNILFDSLINTHIVVMESLILIMRNQIYLESVIMKTHVETYTINKVCVMSFPFNMKTCMKKSLVWTLVKLSLKRVKLMDFYLKKREKKINMLHV